MVLDTAVNGRGDLLVTFKLDDFARAAKIFAQRTFDHEMVRKRPAKAMKFLNNPAMSWSER